jgi:hypothetical protein
MRWTAWALALVLALGGFAIQGSAAETAVPDPLTAEGAPADEPSKWYFEAMPYAWISANYGTATVDGTTVQIEVTPDDLLNLLFDGNAFAAAGYFALGYERIGAFIDSMGGYAEEAVNQTIPTQLCTLTVRAKDKIKFVITDFAVSYRLGEWTIPKRRRPLTLGVYAGLRYMHFGNELDVSAGAVGGAQKAGNVDETFNWADPLIGVQWSAPLHDMVSLDFRGDIGGFGASSDLIWGLVGTFKIWLPWKPFSLDPYLAAGYRVAAFDRSFTGGDIDLQFRGPTMGGGFTF